MRVDRQQITKIDVFSRGIRASEAKQGKWVESGCGIGGVCMGVRQVWAPSFCPCDLG